MSADAQNSQGTYLARARRADCGQCGRQMEKAHRIHLGTGYCTACYARIFPPRPCHVCGKTARAHRNDDRPTCADCHREDRTCMRCGKLTPKAALRVGQQVACAACAHYFRKAEPCELCATPSTRLSRSRACGHNARMCEKCLRKAVGATCSHCAKHRTVHFMTLDRQPLCRNCCTSPASSHPCPDCGTAVGGAGTSRCMPCAIKHSNVARQKATQHLLVSPAVRQLYADFIRWGNDGGRASKLAAGASRYLQFLTRLDVPVHNGATLDERLILQVFTSEDLRQMGLLTRHLSESGLLNEDALARRRRSDERLLASKRLSIASQPWAEDVQRFEASLAACEPPLALRTRKAYVHAAISLLAHAAVQRPSEISQKALDSLLAKKPGLRTSLSVFLTHLNEIHGTRLKAAAQRPRPAATARIAKYVRSLLDALQTCTERPARLSLTAKLLSKLLNAPIEEVTRIRHSDMDHHDYSRLRLRGEWLQLPAQLAPILASLPSETWKSGLDSDPLLFEGRLLIDGLSAAAVDYHVKPVVRARLSR